MIEISKAVEELEFENFVLDRYMKRLNIKSDIQDESKISNSIYQRLETSYIGARSSRNRSRIRNIGADRALRLNPEQKCTIAKVEIESFNQELTAYRENAESILDDYRVLVTPFLLSIHRLIMTRPNCRLNSLRSISITILNLQRSAPTNLSPLL